MANLLDNFAGTSGTNLTSHTSDSGNTWTTLGGSAALLDGSGGVYNADNASNPAVYTSNYAVTSDDIYTLTLNLIGTAGANQFCGIQARASGSNPNLSGYLFRAEVSVYHLYKDVSNAFTLLATYAVAPVNGDVMSFEVANVGPNVVMTCKVNGTLCTGVGFTAGVVTDSSGPITTLNPVSLAIYGNGATPTTGLHAKQITAAPNATLLAGSTTLSISGTVAAPVANVVTTTATLGTAPYTYQLQRAPDSSGSPGTYANVGAPGSGLTFTDATGTKDTIYWYRVQVTDSSIVTETANSNGVQILYRATGTYFFATSGSDSNTGTSSGSPWQTIAKANAYGTIGGDTFQWNKGDTFSGNLVLTVPTAGTQPTLGLPITVTSYGSGANPVISCGDGHGVKCQNMSYVTVANLTITGSGVTYTGTTGPLGIGAVVYTTSGFGVFFVNTGATQLTGGTITNCSIGGCYVGILVSGNGTAAPNGKGYTGLRVTNNTVTSAVYMGIQTINWPNGPLAGSPDWTGSGVHVNPYVGYNVVFNVYGNYVSVGQPGGNCGYPYYIAHQNGGTLERNVGHDCGFACSPSGGGGPVGVEFVVTTNVFGKFNEIYNISQGHSGNDGGGMDFDGASNGCVHEGNYLHDCGGPAFEQGTSVGGSANNTIRFNVVARCGQAPSTCGFVYTVGGSALTVHNNTVLHTSSTVAMMVPFTNVIVNYYNNILICSGSGAKFTNAGPGLYSLTKLNGNIYDAQNGASFSVTINSSTYTSLAALQAAGYETLQGLNTGFVGSSLLNSPTTAPTGGTLPGAQVATLTNFDQTASSPAIGTGLDILELFGLQSTVDFHCLPVRTSPSSTSSGYPVGAVGYGGGGLVGAGLPAAGQVQSGVVYGSAGSQFTGTLSGGGGGGGRGRFGIGF